MSISTDYPHPVTVNGYSCRNCTDVDYAKKHIDPAHPKSGPYGVTADSDPSNANSNANSFIRLGGSLKDTATATAAQAIARTAGQTTAQSTAPGRSLNIFV